MANPMTKSPNAPISNSNRFYGKYQGIVIQNIDLEQVGRVQRQVSKKRSFKGARGGARLA